MVIDDTFMLVFMSVCWFMLGFALHLFWTVFKKDGEMGQN